ncbi:hypothetical protein BU24DRAFT_420757 [Aaosphaeria arxii CBS 175.79]|uniref:Uncharacterized protein n=1 Tax=Aaosphaeria arxii CBS 175.79 TaxID=1450172 RepID=A0A6A5XYJ1_9PLEO|nr:uncharacterized protein BU24DRAFT_420757 [Aaosphaeria arxii CBS 175.79]KAF2017710.1 hypothetical protein BU24DRAFT_420757 [Aaosphaeria arxii CBS 175.79]
MFLCIGLALLVRRGAALDTVAWSSAPNVRGTWDLIASCVLTLTICVWSALHLNVPTEKSTLTERNLRRTRWILLGVFAPELVVSSAFAQYLTARWLRRELLSDLNYSKAEGHHVQESAEVDRDTKLRGWTITQCYFAVMGGITVQAEPVFGSPERYSLTPDGVRLLSFLGHLPDIQETQVRDKSKADGLAKTLVCLQAGWMILQMIARLHQRLPVTLLEINTIGHVLCALVLYLLWWSKPLEVKDPVLLPYENWMDPYLSLMWMCSPISGSSEDEITEMRCMTYIPSERRSTLPSMDIPTIAIEHSTCDSPTDARPAAHETHFSVGSTAARNPRKFIGPLGDFRVGSGSRSPSPAPFDHHVSYMIAKTAMKPAPEHEVFFQLQEPHHGLQHSASYCRRGFDDCKDHSDLSPIAIRRWQHACTLIDTLWNECEKRPSYINNYFTISTLGTFVGEIGYIDTHAPNILGLSYLGGVNIHKDRMKSVLAFAGAAYGAIHIAAWNDFFPTQVERYLWITSSVAIGASGIFLWIFFLIKERVEKIDRAASRAGRTKVFSLIARFVIVPLFIIARVYLVVEAFVSLRRVPKEVYETPEWTRYLPHL